MQKTETIPEARRDAVGIAIRTAFGASAAGDFEPIRGGVSGALILRLDIHQRSYVLRIEPERTALHDRQRGFACIRAAAIAGAAPPLHYADPTTGVAIMDFVSGRPLSQHPCGPLGMVRALGALIARVQETPPFPIIDDYPRMIENLLIGLSNSGFFVPGQLDRHAEGLQRIRAVLPWDASSLVSCHNDPNPRNILFDGERAWLIDWELAFRNDPLVDIAILTTELAEAPELEDALLEAAFGLTPIGLLRTRLNVIRLLTRLFYGCIVLDSLVGRLRSIPDVGRAASTPAAFRAAVAEGRLASGTLETAYAFAKMSLTAFIDDLEAPGFDDMLERVRQS